MESELNLRKLPLEKPGVGLRKDHYRQIIEGKPNLGFLEVHSENYFGFGPELDLLKAASSIYPISLHGVGLSLGSYDKVPKRHLKSLKKLVDYINPSVVSDHATWALSGNAHMNDLLPIPYNKESLAALCDNVNRTQDYLGRQILIENPSTYLQFKSEMPEYEFISKAADRCDCKILLDVNNIYVNAMNHKLDAKDFIDNIDASKIGEIHLAGHSVESIEGVEVRIDTHDKIVVDEVWDLYDYTIRTKGALPTLIEWDKNIPSLDVLLLEAKKAKDIIDLNMEENAA